jgi:hypothetical protein
MSALPKVEKVPEALPYDLLERNVESIVNLSEEDINDMLAR